MFTAKNYSGDTRARRLSRQLPALSACAVDGWSREVENCTYEEGRGIALRNGGSISSPASVSGILAERHVFSRRVVHLAGGSISQESSL